MDEAEVVSDNLIKANLRGVDSHGIFFLPRLVTKVLNETIKLGAEIRVLNKTPSTALINGGHGFGQHGFGQVVGVEAMNMAIEKAKTYGVGAVSARSTNHFGMAAYYATLALNHDMIGLV